MPAMTSEEVTRPVIVITGANSGVGFGLAQRLLVQLSSPTPPDTLVSNPHLTPRDEKPFASPFAAPDGCILILACRNPIKAHRARAQLQSLLQYLEDLPGDADTPISVPAIVLDVALDAKINGSIDEDADPALVVQAMQASLRRRKRRSAAVNYPEQDEKGNKDPTRDPRTGRSYSLYEREIRARERYRRRFCAGTKIEIQALDLGSMASALICAKEITARHRYVTHVILNAGSGTFTGINWAHCIWMMITNFHGAVTYPQYKMQRAGDVGRDGYGFVWQANLGAHYILTRALLPALRSTPYSTPSRIIWTGSLEAREDKYTPSDFQCVDAAKSPKPYDSCKYQCEIAALGMEELLNRSRLTTQPGTPLPLSNGEQITTSTTARTASGLLEPKCFLAQPGVVASSIFTDCINVFMAICMKLSFYIARWTMSKHHNIDGYKGAVAASHVALAPASQLNSSLRYGAQSDFYGREYVIANRTDAWYDNKPSGPGKKEKQKMVEMETPSMDREGDYVRLLARDLIIKCEGVAKRVWREAREGALPPFTEPEDDNYSTEGRGRNEEAKVAILDPNLLPRVEGVKESSGLVQTEGSLSSQESWEKVDEAV